MFTDLELFKEERQKFYDSIREVNESNFADKDVRIRELNVKFRDDIRKYLPTCLNVINNNYNCHFSIYKTGKDYDANFNVIETSVKKTRGEIECELTNYRSLLNVTALSEHEQAQLDLATEIILMYVDDPTEPKKEKDPYLESAKPIASSIMTNVPRMDPTRLAQEEKDNSQAIQYNPYANQPIDVTQGMDQEPQEDNSNALNIFGTNNTSVSGSSMNLDSLLSVSPAPVPTTEEQPTQDTGIRSGVFFDQSIIDGTNAQLTKEEPSVKRNMNGQIVQEYISPNKIEGAPEPTSSYYISQQQAKEVEEAMRGASDNDGPSSMDTGNMPIGQMNPGTYINPMDGGNNGYNNSQ